MAAKIQSCYLCGGCKQPILKPEDGYVVQGNIYTANPDSREGYVGNPRWLSQIEHGENRIFIGDIPEVAYCKVCFCKALNIKCVEIR